MRLAAGAILAALTLFAQEHAVEGNPKSAVRVIAYEDLQCSDCAVYRKMMDEQLLPKYGAAVAFEHRDFPLAKHAWARPASLVARHLDRTTPALGIEFRRWAMANQTSITPENFESKVTEWCKLHHADASKALAAVRDPALRKAVDEDREDGIARGVARTPTVLVNGTPFIETFTLEEISKGIDAALAAVSPRK